MGLRVEPVVRVEHRISKVVERRAVPVVCSGTRQERYLPSRCPAVLGGVAGRVDPEFLQIVHGDEALCRAECGLAWKRSSRSAPGAATLGARARVRSDSVHGEIVLFGTLAVDAELALGSRAGPGHRRYSR